MSINQDRPNGFTPIGTISGAPWTGYIRAYQVDSGEGTGIFIGDAITLEADGNVAAAAAGEPILGVCVGVPPHINTPVNGKYDNFLSSSSPSLAPAYSAASTADTIYVCVGADVLYEVQEDGDTDPIALIDVGQNFDLVAGAGSTTTGRSAHELDSDSQTTASAQFRLVAIVDRPDNQQGDIDTTLPNCRWIVRINENHFNLFDQSVTTGTVGPTGLA